MGRFSDTEVWECRCQRRARIRPMCTAIACCAFVNALLWCDGSASQRCEDSVGTDVVSGIAAYSKEGNLPQQDYPADAMKTNMAYMYIDTFWAVI